MLRSRVSLIAATAAFLLLAAAGCSEDKELRIEKISPKEGAPSGDEVVRIYGNGFQQGQARNVQVYFGTSPAAKVSIVSDDEIAVHTPGSGGAEKTVDILIVFDDGMEKRVKDAYTYKEPTRLDVGDLVGEEKKR
jgi:hypothetical protein